jgi:hypothetical protein
MDSTLENVKVCRNNGQCDYGSWMSIDEAPGWVRQLVAEQIIEEGLECGTAEQGGSRWTWTK